MKAPRKEFRQRVYAEAKSRCPWVFEPDEFGYVDYEEQEYVLDSVEREFTELTPEEEEERFEEELRKKFNLGNE